MPIEDIYRGGNSKSRNPHMQIMLRLVGFGDNAASGFSAIIDIWKKEGWVKPELTENPDLNQVTLLLKMVKKSEHQDLCQKKWRIRNAKQKNEKSSSRNDGSSNNWNCIRMWEKGRKK